MHADAGKDDRHTYCLRLNTTQYKWAWSNWKLLHNHGFTIFVGYVPIIISVCLKLLLKILYATLSFDLVHCPLIILVVVFTKNLY